MKFIKYFFTGIVLVAATSSCDDFEDLNRNPNDPVVVPASQLLADLVLIGTDRLYSTFNGGDMGAAWAQHWAKVQYNDEARYSPRQSSIEVFWDQFYEDVLSDARTMELLAAGEGNQVAQGAALVMEAYALSVLTDIYGDIPNTEAVRASEGLFTPAYDAQELVYDSIFAKLDRADALLAGGSGVLTASFDVVFGGDASKWRKFANSLKFRGLMRISGVKSVGAELTALMARPMFTSSADEAKVAYLSAQPNANPIYETIVFGTRGEWKIAEPLVTTLTDLNDPRLAVYAQPNDAGIYRGKPAGIRDVPNEEYNYNNVSAVGLLYLEPDAPAVLMSYSELLFLMAEAADRSLITGDANALYQSAITENMSRNGITTGVADYLAQGSVAFSSDNIQIQKWIALYTQGIEAWTEWRRTGLPALSPALDANPTIGEIPSRLTYPATEQTTNNANWKAAGGESITLTSPVWWMGN